MPWKWSQRIWSRIHVDFFGSCLGQPFFIIEDATSKWIECFPVNRITSAVAVSKLREVFERIGLPRELCSDGAQCFASEEFQFFLRKCGIKHLTGAPFHPATNGQAENAVKILKRALLKAQHSKVADSNLILNRFLFHYRSTPHSTTQETPAKMLIGRNLQIFIYYCRRLKKTRK